MAFNIFATATSDIPLANLDANFTMIGSSAVASTLYPTATTSITYGTAGTSHIFSGSIGAFTLSGTVAGGGNQLNNVIIGTTTPLAGAFTTLSATGNATIGSGVTTTGMVLGVDTGGSIAVGASSGDAVIRAAVGSGTTNRIIFAQGNTGTQYGMFDASGNLGLGVTPSAWSAGFSAFQFSTTGTVWSNGGNANIGSNHYFNGSNYIYRTTDYASRLQQINGQFQFYTAPSGTAGNAITFTQAMTLDSSGNLLVGATAPYIAAFTGISVQGLTSGTANLSLGLYKTGTPQIASGDVLGNIYFYGVDNNVTAGNNNIGARIASIATTDWTTDGTTSNAALVFYTHGTTSGAPEERARIDSSGNLGIGNTTPSTSLSGSVGIAINSAANGNTQIRLQSTSTGTGGTDGLLISLGTTNDAYLYNYENANLIFGTNNTVRARIDSSGNLLVGTSSAISGGGAARLEVVTAATSDGLWVKNTNAGSSTHVVWNASTTGDATFSTFCTETALAVRGSITYNRAGGLTVYNTTSDYRLKEHIVDLPDALETVSRLKPRQFDWKETGNTTTGFIAHELAEVCPHAVTGEKDATEMRQYEISPAIPATQDEEGNELTAAVEAVMGEREVPRYQGIDTSFLVATLTAALQEAHGLIKDLTTRITALEAK